VYDRLVFIAEQELYELHPELLKVEHLGPLADIIKADRKVLGSNLTEVVFAFPGREDRIRTRVADLTFTQSIARTPLYELGTADPVAFSRGRTSRIGSFTMRQTDYHNMAFGNTWAGEGRFDLLVDRVQFLDCWITSVSFSERNTTACSFQAGNIIHG